MAPEYWMAIVEVLRSQKEYTLADKLKKELEEYWNAEISFYKDHTLIRKSHGKTT